MPNPNSTIRQARNAIYLVINGAIRDIEAHCDESECQASIESLFANVRQEVDDWDIPAGSDKCHVVTTGELHE